MMVIERPLDLLNRLRGKEIALSIKSQTESIIGKLHAFDIHINLVVETSKGYLFVRGDEVRMVEALNIQDPVAHKPFRTRKE